MNKEEVSEAGYEPHEQIMVTVEPEPESSAQVVELCLKPLERCCLSIAPAKLRFEVLHHRDVVLRVRHVDCARLC